MYAEVSVNSPVSQRRTFSYAIPSGMPVQVGQAVWVPFGQRLLQGIIVELTEQPAVEETKEIAGIIESRPLLSSAQVSLARWISGYYLSPLFEALALMLPPGFERKALAYVSLAPSAAFDTSSLTPEQRRALALIPEGRKLDVRQLEKALGKKKAQEAVLKLVRRGLLVRSYETEPLRVRPRLKPFLRLAVASEQARQEIATLSKRAKQQAALLEFLIDQEPPVPLAEVRLKVKCTAQTVHALANRGLVAVEYVEVKREAFAHQAIAPSHPLLLTAAQKVALDAIKPGLSQTMGHPTVFLLRGVTGSGKTEVYLQALAEAVRLGKRGIVLVPEISLTPQTIERFSARFPGKVAVLHSRLSLGEQFDEWRRIRDGEFDVVIGARSALFAPQPDLGLIIIDEEHEWTYKQDDQAPRYHARDAALKLAELIGAAVVLGSATPDVETYYRAQTGEFRLLELPERVTPTENSPLPQVEVVDMRNELKAGNRSLFSRSLSQAIAKAIAEKEQVILFLNRRGGATFVQCRKCGFVLRCRRCDIALTHHLTGDVLVCHQCNYRMPVPAACPRCRSQRIKFLGVGTEKVELEAGHNFLEARLLRWDSDATREKHSHEEILTKFRTHQADILIGTQMVAKGLDLPLVTLVGVINADTGLNLPDFRAGERTFQLLSQVAGRAGRGPLGGRVVVQTYSPEHYAIQAAARHDYALFYNREIAFRRQLGNPPFARLARLVYAHTSNALCQKAAERMKQVLVEERDARGIAGLDVIGPAPAFIHRLRGRFRWQLVLRGPDLSAFLSTIPIPQGWAVDIDPVAML